MNNRVSLARGLANAFPGLLISLLMLQTPASAQSADPQQISAFSDKILSKEIDLLKLNTNLRLSQLPAPWAGRRWWLFNMAGVALTATGAYMNGFGRFAYLKKTRINKAPKWLFVDAAICRVTANGVMVGGGLLESAVLALKDYRDRRKGIDFQVMHKYADELQNEIDALLAQRESLVSKLESDSQRRRVYEAEGRVLRDVRDLAVNEFVRFYADVKGARAFFHTSYLWAAASNFIAGSGGVVGIHANLTTHHSTRYRTRLGGYGGIADIISGSMNQAVPLVIRLASHAAASSSKNKLCKQLDCAEPAHLDDLHAHQEDLHNLLPVSSAGEGTSLMRRDSILAKTTQIFDEHEKIRLGDVKAKKRRLVSQLIFFSGIGTPKTVNGIGTTVAAFEYTASSKKQQQFKTIGGTATTYGVGYSVALAELIRYQLLSELSAVKAHREGRSAGQVLSRELAELEALSQESATND